MTNEEITTDILHRQGRYVSATFDQDNYREVKGVIIRALGLADEGKLSEALKVIAPIEEGIRAEVEAVLRRKARRDDSTRLE